MDNSISWFSTNKDSIEALSTIVEIIAIFLAGLWTWMLFIRHREFYPKAEILHDITHLNLEHESKLLIKLAVRIKNIGKTVLVIESVETYLQKIVPTDEQIENALESNLDPVKEKEIETRWPIADKPRKYIDETGDTEIEAGEKQIFYFDFFIEKDIKIIQAYTYVTNIFRKRTFFRKPKRMGWDCSIIYDIEKQKCFLGEKNGKTTETATT